jgi:hypothetical protein
MSIHARILPAVTVFAGYRTVGIASDPAVRIWAKPWAQIQGAGQRKDQGVTFRWSASNSGTSRSNSR